MEFYEPTMEFYKPTMEFYQRIIEKNQPNILIDSCFDKRGRDQQKRSVKIATRLEWQILMIQIQIQKELGLIINISYLQHHCTLITSISVTILTSSLYFESGNLSRNKLY